MRIGEVASEAAVNVQTLRYYERVGLLPRPDRSPSGYREYGATAVRRVRFVKRAQELGFTLAEVNELLGFRERSHTTCHEVEARASATLGRINDSIRDLERIRTALSRYVDTCRKGPPLGECPLLQALDQPVD